VTARAVILIILGCLAARAEALQEFRLPNGLRVLLAENHERPLVRLELRTAWNPAEEPPGKEGLGGFLADLLETGAAAPLKREAFQRYLEDRALKLEFSLYPRSFAWSVLSDSQGQDGAFASLAMTATRQDFEPAAVEVRRQRLLLAARESTPRLRGEARFRRRIGDPSASPIPEEQAFLRIEYQDLLRLARRVLRPENSVLAIHGDMNLSQARQLSLLHLGAWGPSAEAPLAPGADPSPDPPHPTRTWLVAKGGKSVQIQVGSSRPVDLQMPHATLAVVGSLVRRDLAGHRPAALANVDFLIFPEGGWRLQAAASPGVSVAGAMEAVQGLLARLREKRVENGEWSSARLAWDRERRTRVLHPSQEVSALAAQALQPKGLDARLEVGEVQAALGQLFEAEACSYLITGASPQDALWLDKGGLGPVESVN